MAEKMYKILINDTLGRYIAASKQIKAGELILVEEPVLVGPQLDGPSICFNCCRNVRISGYIFCRNCNKAIICGPKCTGNLHTTEECLSLKEASVTGEILARYGQIVFPLRCILWKKYKTNVFESFMQLESHLERRRDTHIWRRHKIAVEDILRYQLFENVNNELVQKVCGILDVNSFEIRPPTSSVEMIKNPGVQCLRGLYLQAALMAHDCVGNTHLSVDDDFLLRIHASVDIPEGTPIFFNYCNVLQGTIDRKQHLREGKYFECCCVRCKDATELGTDLSSLKCHRCRKGLIRLINPETAKSNWECVECSKKFASGLINLTVQEGRRRIHDLGRENTILTLLKANNWIRCFADYSNINEMEKLLATLSVTFHPNHFLILELQQNMAGAYTRLPPNKKNLSRKIALCQWLLNVFCKIEPGLSRMKALTLYELQSSLIDLSNKQHRDKEITDEKLVTKLLSAESILKESIQHLLYEPLKSPEGKIAQRAMYELKMLRTSISSIQEDVLKSSKQRTKLGRRIGRELTDNDENKIDCKTEEDKELIKDKLENGNSKSSRRRRHKKKNIQNNN
ncbi:hypothetical protein NQ315_001992 [Exocentrus adspersus]|uniref:SET domain-containing protein n=1 Tax=Exocentrus adspersus TaxID=1586481 RepID=A0AAV8WAU2_9CUCU|nr:hypothetical protein NQ315_001992 [Exocentrus adspersus]